MTDTPTAVELHTGELVPLGVERMTPAEAAEQATWLRDVMGSVLTEGVDYGQIGNAERPTLLKAGAEMLILAAGLSFDMTRIEDVDALEHRGVYYRCTVKRGDHVRAVCEAYAGYDENRFVYRGGGRAPWNTLIKMAQKRALVGAALNAVAGSGLFVADIDDEVRPAPRANAETPPCDNDAAETTTGAASVTSQSPTGAASAVLARVDALGPDARRAFDAHREAMRWPWPPTSPAVIKAADKQLDALEADR